MGQQFEAAPSAPALRARECIRGPLSSLAMPLRNLLRASALVFALATCGCASGPQIRVDMDTRVNIRAYKTFAFLEHVSTDGAGYASLLSTRLKAATAAQLERLGYKYSTTEPELVVNFFLKIVNKQEVRSTGGYYGYRAGYYGTWTGYPYLETVDYKQGTLSIDLVDAKQKQLVWQGIAEGEVSEQSQRDPGPAIDQVVSKIFSNFPNAPQ